MLTETTGQVCLDGRLIAEIRFGRGLSGWQFRLVGPQAPALAYLTSWQMQRDKRKRGWTKEEVKRRIEFILGYSF